MRATDYIGVRWKGDRRMFVSTLILDGEQLYCGASVDPREAAKLRDIAIIKYGLPVEKLQVLKPVKK
jgi:hypothetical protein